MSATTRLSTTTGATFLRGSTASGRYDREWRDRAACLCADVDVFFPIGSTGAAADEIGQAKAVCATCPVSSECLRFALTTNQEFGVWGGLDEDERRILRRLWRQG